MNMNSNTFLSVIKENASLVEKAMEQKLDSIKLDPGYDKFSTLEESIRYSLLAGGKRLRPTLVIEFAKLFGAQKEVCLEFACAIEMIHTFSLIHDDMPCMDNDELRRGKPTNHVIYGEDTALLAGDALLAFAFESAICEKLSDKQNLLAIKVLSYFTGPCGMCAGQQIDLQSEGKTIDISTLETLHVKKTGALIKCACILGCIAAGKFEGSKEYGNAVKYAECIGLAFQIADDILDVTGDEAKLGKKCGSDSKENKNTYVTLCGLEESRALAKKLCEKAKSLVSEYENCEFLCELADFIIDRDN